MSGNDIDVDKQENIEKVDDDFSPDKPDTIESPGDTESKENIHVTINEDSIQDDNHDKEYSNAQGHQDDEEEDNFDNGVIDDRETEEIVKDNPLTIDHIKENISLLCKVGDGLSHAFVKLDCIGRELSNIDILSTYIHLRCIDLSKNKLKDVSSLNTIKQLLTLKCDNNLLPSCQLETLPYIKIISMSGNKLEHTSNFNHPQLEHLILNDNRIKFVEKLDPEVLTRLHTVELRGNRLSSADGLHIPSIKNLYLADNLIDKISGIYRLEHLTRLHLRGNNISQLGGFSEYMRCLQYINFRNNQIADVKEVGKLRCLPVLRGIILSENPIAEDEEYRMEVLIALRKLARLDKDDYTDEEREEAESVFQQRRQDEQANEDAQEVIESDGEEQKQ